MTELRAAIAWALIVRHTAIKSPHEDYIDDYAEALADAVLAAIATEAVVIDRERWERIAGTVRQAERLEGVLHERFGYLDEIGLPFRAADLTPKP